MNALLRTLYLELVKALTPATFTNCLDALIKELPGAILSDPTSDAAESFNAIFPTRACYKLQLNRMPENLFVGDAQLAHEAFCTASVFNKLSQEKHPTEANMRPHAIGWEGGLNKDAKGWCKFMLLCEIPCESMSFPASALNDLLRARWEVLQIVRDHLPIADIIRVTTLDHLRPIAPQDTMNGNVDE